MTPTTAPPTTTTVKQKIFSTFFGCSAEECPDNVVITPIDFILNDLSTGRERKRYRGWQECVGLSNAALICVPQGEPVKDAVIALEEAHKEITFIGLCGGLKDGMNIGDIVVPYTISSGVNTLLPEVYSECYSRVRVGDVRSVITPDHRVLRERYDVVEMETYHVITHSPLTNIYLIVSDTPLTRPFYDIQEEDRLKIKKAIRELSTLLLGDKHG